MCALFTATGSAQESALQQFDVELVVFRLANPNPTPEDWSVDEARPAGALAIADKEETAVTPAPDAGAAAAVTEGAESSIQPISVAQFKLNAIENALRRNRSYLALAHVAWSQPGFGMDNPRPLALESMLPPDAPVTGKVSLVRGRYLHLSLELAMVSPTDGKRYVLREQRRMRSGEKHYFDHPYFGVIVLVTPKT